MPSHLLRRVGHHRDRITIGIYLALIAAAFVDDLVDLPEHAAFVGYTIAIAGIILIGVPGALHADSLCERCIEAMPLDGQAKAEQWQRSLRVAHLPGKTKLRILVIFIVFVLLVDRGSETIGEGIASLVTFGPLIAHLLVLMRHNLVQPWCKQCHWGDGDGGESVEAPDPDPAVSRR